MRAAAPADQSFMQVGYSGLLLDAMVQKKYAVKIIDESHHLYSMVGRPNSTPEALFTVAACAVQVWATALRGCFVAQRGSAPRTMDVSQDVGMRAK